MTAARAYTPRHFPSGGPHRRHISAKPRKGGSIVLREDHGAVVDARTLFPSTRRHVEETKRILKSGMNQRKLGRMVLKGRWRGFPIYALTLEERATCPSTCAMWRACYGNGMHMAERVVHDDEFEVVLRLELESYQALHPGGFVVRLHVLGDFYSVDYVRLWQRALTNLPALNVFGFTARERSDPIGRELRKVAGRFGRRFAMRWSGESGPMGAVTVERGAATPITVCPAQQREDRFCGNCGLCWHSKAPVAFWRH
ncbi:MAG TPA: hypothetical protein DEP91_03095 [Sphingomonas bacterium]|jgi:hypothetical protein|uniref:Uncharacterized protein n=1 Tax=Sphingomonas bacterium TaxID=1895847 RepID=A0A3D0W8R4_9SPHN|nr:hypothetical protein [Sphingomonas bacterium]